ncbi:MAG: hypothetical protein QXO67_03520 [Candidatus Bathyarchaeia archaeon]
MRVSFRRLYAVSLILESCGIIITASGIAVELTFKAPLGYMLITFGSMLIALGGLLWSKALKRGKG